MTATQIEHVAHDAAGCDGWTPETPQSVSRERVLELVASLGIDPQQTRSLAINPDAIEAEVYAVKDGNRYWEGDNWGGGNDVQAATHRVTIPIA